MPILGNGRGFTLLLAGAAVLATGCVEHQVTYVQPTEPPAYQPPPAEPPPPPEVVVAPAPAIVLHSPRELDQMVASIALYPDPLLAQILPAATVPQQIISANSYVAGGGDPRFVDSQPWDSSVRAVARYPEVLRMMNDNLAWTTDLGRSFLNQPADVMDAVQRLRAEARALGNLYSTPEQVVYVEGGTIIVAPAVRDVIYVPVYRPEVVYVERPPAPNRFYVSFSIGRPMGVWLNHDCDWHERRVVVWHHDHPRPTDWWQHPPNERPREETHITAWHAPAHGEVPPAHHEAPPQQAHRPPQGQPKPLPVATHPAPPQHQPQPAPVVHSGAHPVPPAESRKPESGVAHSGAHLVPGSANGAPPAQPSHPALPPADPTHQPVRYPPVASSGPGVAPVPAPLPRPAGGPALKDPNQRPDGAFVPAPKDPRVQLPPRPAPSSMDQSLPARPVAPPPSDNQANKNPNSHGANAQSSHGNGEANGHAKQAHEGVGKPTSAPKSSPENKDKEQKNPKNPHAD